MIRIWALVMAISVGFVVMNGEDKRCHMDTIEQVVTVFAWPIPLAKRYYDPEYCIGRN